MASLPRATVNLVQSGGGVASGSDLVAVLSCTSAGTASVCTAHTRVQEAVDAYGLGEGLDFAAHLVEVTKKPFLFVKMLTGAAGALLAKDITHVTGTSVITFTGTPVDFAEIKLACVTGGTIGTAGIVIKVSTDGGRKYGGNIRLGTATSYVIPGSGVTAAFAAGTLVAGDYATQACAAPTPSGAGITAAFDAIVAQGRLPRLIVICGDVDGSVVDLQDIIDEIEAYETTDGRHARVICAARDWYPDAVMQGEPSDVDFDGTADTITRATGSWVTDGFKVGMTATVDGTASNDGFSAVLTDVTATVLTFAAGITTEANVDGANFTITAEETKSSWRTAIETIVGSTPSTAKNSDRTCFVAGRARRKSPLDGSKKRRPFAWPLAIRAMEHDLHISPAKVALGGLSGWSITDADGNLEEHDERVDGGLLGIRVACATTNDEFAGVFVALPVTLAEDNTPLSRLQVGFVSDLCCTVAKRETTRRLNEDVVLDPTTGFMLDSEREAINKYVEGQLRAALLTQGPEGQRASDVTFELASDVDMRTPGTAVPWEAVLTTLGYIERLSGTVRVPAGGE